MNELSFAPPSAFQTSFPLVVFNSMQQEFVTPGRRFSLPKANEAIEHCLTLLAHVREWGLPVAHMRHVSHNFLFNPVSPFSSWIEGFTPRPSEMLFERTQPSCYSSPEFTNLLQSTRDPHLVLVGFSGNSSCFATIFDAYHRGHKVTFLHDASASSDVYGHDTSNIHPAVCSIAAQFCHVTTTQGWMNENRGVFSYEIAI